MPTFTHIRNTIKPKGKIVYEYNPLYNYRPTALDGEIDDLKYKIEELEISLEENYRPISKAEQYGINGDDFI